MKLKQRIALLMAMLMLSIAPAQWNPANAVIPSPLAVTAEAASATLPSYNGKPYTPLNGNVPSFTAEQKKNTTAFETYHKLDGYGRCGVAFANICEEIMPTEPRGSISSIHPSGWQSNMGWERCHLIGYQLAAENANAKNLITGTRYLNVTGMLPFENMVADYVKETGNHVLYRVTPKFKGSNLIASGVQMEGWSVEDDGDGICFNVYVFNVQPGKTINYANGKVTNADSSSKQTISATTVSKTYKASALKKSSRSFSMGIKTSSGAFSCQKASGSARLSVSRTGKVTVRKGTSAGTYKMKVKITAKRSSGYKQTTATKTVTVKVTKSSGGNSGGSGRYVLNTNTRKFHLPGCSAVARMSERNKAYASNRSSIIRQGYDPCKLCHP